MCALVAPRVRPTIVPRAYMSQCGAPRPVKAGTMYTPALSGTEEATSPLSAAEEMSPSSSRSHCMALPALNTLPSMA